MKLARTVSQAGVTLEVGGRPLMERQNERLERGGLIVVESDVQTFLNSVTKLGGWESNEHYKSVYDFLHGPKPLLMGSAVFPELHKLTELPLVCRSSNAKAHPGRVAPLALMRSSVQTVLRKPAVEVPVVESASADVSSVTKTSRALTTKQAKVSKKPIRQEIAKQPLRKHPVVSGMVLQDDGFYWNPAWDKK